MAQLDDLPPELLFMITRELLPRQEIKISHVCRKLRHIFCGRVRRHKRGFKLYEELSVDVNSVQAAHKELQARPQILPYIETLNVVLPKLFLNFSSPGFSFSSQIADTVPNDAQDRYGEVLKEVMERAHLVKRLCVRLPANWDTSSSPPRDIALFFETMNVSRTLPGLTSSEFGSDGLPFQRLQEVYLAVDSFQPINFDWILQLTTIPSLQRLRTSRIIPAPPIGPFANPTYSCPLYFQHIYQDLLIETRNEGTRLMAEHEAALSSGKPPSKLTELVLRGSNGNLAEIGFLILQSPGLKKFFYETSQLAPDQRCSYEYVGFINGLYWFARPSMEWIWLREARRSCADPLCWQVTAQLRASPELTMIHKFPRLRFLACSLGEILKARAKQVDLLAESLETLVIFDCGIDLTDMLIPFLEPLINLKQIHASIIAYNAFENMNSRVYEYAKERNIEWLSAKHVRELQKIHSGPFRWCDPFVNGPWT